MPNVTIIDVFNHIFVSEVILKTRIIKTKRTRTIFLNLLLLSSCNYFRGFILFVMPVDIEQWCAGIGDVNRCCQYSVARFELRMYNIFCTIVMLVCVFLLIPLCISSLNTTLHLWFDSSVFTFSSSVLELLIYKIICLKRNILPYCIESVNYIYQQISYTCMLNIISSFHVLYFVYFLHLFLLQHGDIERNPDP